MEGGGILSAAALFLLGTLQALHAQKNPFLEQIRNFPQEKIHVTTDRDAYIAGDTVWLRAHCVDAATLEPLTASRYVYVELRTTDNLLVRRIKILQRGGVYAGYLPLPATLAQDEYVLCAYTLYMRNLGGDYLFSKPLSINPYRQPEKRRRRTAAGPFDVAFFPEGGYLIDGQPCRGPGQGRTFAAGDGNRARRPWPHRRAFRLAPRRHGVVRVHAVARPALHGRMRPDIGRQGAALRSARGQRLHLRPARRAQRHLLRRIRPFG